VGSGRLRNLLVGFKLEALAIAGLAVRLLLASLLHVVLAGPADLTTENTATYFAELNYSLRIALRTDPP
jgi:recombinational DNA repair protein RecR